MTKIYCPEILLQMSCLLIFMLLRNDSCEKYKWYLMLLIIIFQKHKESNWKFVEELLKKSTDAQVSV